MIVQTIFGILRPILLVFIVITPAVAVAHRSVCLLAVAMCDITADKRMLMRDSPRNRTESVHVLRDKGVQHIVRNAAMTYQRIFEVRRTDT